MTGMMICDVKIRIVSKLKSEIINSLGYLFLQNPLCFSDKNEKQQFATSANFET